MWATVTSCSHPPSANDELLAVAQIHLEDLLSEDFIR